jgi:hypothetical protein
VRFYVYLYRDPETGVPFYVGKGTGWRMHAHFRQAREPKTFFHRRLRKLLDAGHNPIIEKIEGLDEVDALRIEVETIARLGRLCDGTGPLTNVSPGGDKPSCHKGRCFHNRKPPSTKGKPGKRWSEEDKAEHRARMKAVMASKEIRLRVSQAKTGRQGPSHTAASRAKISAAHKGKRSERKSLSKTGALNPMFGRKWFNDGRRSALFFAGTEPSGWQLGRHRWRHANDR